MKVNLFFSSILRAPKSFCEKTQKNALLKSRFVMGISVLLALSSGQQALAAMVEHEAVQNLVALSPTDRNVVKSGVWSDPATWNGGVLPKAGENIYVPVDKVLTVDVISDVSLGHVRVDGTIAFPAYKSTKLKLDTLVTTETGKFFVGGEKNPVSSYNKVEIVIANNGPINRSLDPFNISRGVILQGKTRIFGIEKSAFHKLAIGADAGATQITLDSIPTGWMKGDIIAITATKFRYKYSGDKTYITQDELRRIKAITGNIITLGAVDNAGIADPLKNSHIPTIKNMPVYAANLTRNVTVTGEGGESVPADQHGHFMIMHNPDTIIKGAGFYYLGRTDKSKPIDDYQLDKAGNRLKDTNGNFIRGANNNPRGRYAVHFHHTGTDIKVAPAIFKGNAVFSGVGWGVVNHTSNVLIENNASYNVYGSHYVSEDGNELGTFRNNIAIKAQGRNSYSKFGIGNHDVGHTGHGFWLESRNLVMDGNVVSGVYNSGVMYFHRNFMPGVNLHIPVENLLTPYKTLNKNLATIYYDRIPITQEKNSTVLASGGGLDVIKADPFQDHDIRSVIDSFKGYAILDGLSLQYTGKYTLNNVELVADKAANRPWHKGMNLCKRVQDIVIANTSLDGFIHPFYSGTVFLGQSDKTEATFINVDVNGRPINLATDLHADSVATIYSYDPAFQHVVASPVSAMPLSGSTSTSSLRYSPETPLSADFPASYNLGYVVKGIKTDSLGKHEYVSKWGYYQLMGAVKKGYYTDAAGNKFILLTDLMSDRFTGSVGVITTKLKLLKTYKELGQNLGPLPK